MATRKAGTQSEVDILMSLLALPGPSGGEERVAKYLQTQLLKAGARRSWMASDNAHRRSRYKGTMGNLILKLPGTERGPRRMLSAHMDTTPICTGAEPVRRGGRIVAGAKSTGLGGDDRAGCAVLLSTATSIIREKLPHPPLTFLWTVQEEVGLLGARHVQKSLLGRPAMGFNWDGGPAGRITLGATGGYRMDILVEGIASHAGVHPERGVSAIAIASLAIAELVRGGWHGLVDKDGEQGTSNIGVVQGGTATNVVCDRVTLKAEARSHDPKFRGRIAAAIENAFTHAASEVSSDSGVAGKATFDGRLDYESYRLSPSEPCAVVSATAVQAEGALLEFVVGNGGLDSNWLNAHGIPTVTLGCGQNSIHTTEEWLNLGEFALACRVARRIATGR